MLKDGDFSRTFFYSPWHDPTEDPVATNLIYQQNVRGVKFGEYRCEKEEDLAMIAAQQYYIEYGNDLNEERLFNLIPNYIPDYCLQRDNAIEMWHHLVLQAYKKVEKKFLLFPQFPECGFLSRNSTQFDV